MQDQGKRLLLAAALVLAVLFAWNAFMPKEEPPPAKPTTGSAESGTTAPGTPATPGTALAGAATPAAVPDAPRPPEATLELKFAHVVATFSSYCGGLKSWHLTDSRYQRDTTKGEILPVKAMFEKHPPAEQTSLPECGAFEIYFASSTYSLPPRAVWTGEKVSDTEVRYTYATPELDIVKTFTVIPEKYIVRMAVKASVKVPEGQTANQRLAVRVFGYQDPEGTKSSWGGAAPRAWASSTMRDHEIVETPVTGVIEAARFEPSIQWTGFEHPYLLAGFAPRIGTGEHVEKYTVASDGKAGVPRGYMQTDVVFPSTAIRHGDAPMAKEVVGYLGPKNYDDLEQAGATAGFDTGFNKVVDLGWFAFIGRPLLWLLQKFHQGVGNWGIAIVLLTILVKAATLYWTTKSMRSMKAMASLAPQMKALQTKYAGDKQRLQAETMALYKVHNVNPVAGCLPILLQMPIWLALYKMLSNTGELYQQAFIPGWIDDLTAPDPLHILPIVLVITMFLQARLQPATIDSAQQKFLQYGMPLMFGAMSFVFPAGSTLYIFTNTVLSALHSIYMNKFDKKSLAIAEQLKKNQEAAVPASTGGAKPPKNGGPVKAKPVIDVKATEVAADAEDDGAEADDAPSSVAGAPGAPRNRPRRKKRRR